MVTAGVYMIVRLHPLFEAAPKVQDTAAGLGALTLLVAGLVALVQTDIKRVIAYSTMSQIGYMFVGVGLGAYASGMFHLMTHAFFKALLFLGAGIVIHALGGEQDMRRMGGLRWLMPKASLAMLIGALSLSGMPGLSGFFSKDAILSAALAGDWYSRLLFAAGAVGAFLTGLYTFRMIFVVWGGEPTAFVREHLMKGSHAVGQEGHAHEGHVRDTHEHAGEGPFSMMSVVAVLAVLSVIGGWIQFSPFWTPITTWLDPVAKPLVDVSGTKELITSVLAVALGLAGIGAAWWIYAARRSSAPRPLALLEHKFYFDELYDLVFYRPAAALATLLRRGVEEPVIEGSITATGIVTREAGEETARVQTGLLRTYAFAIAGSVAILIVVFVSVR